MSIPSISSSFRFHNVNTVSSASTPRTQQAQSPAVVDTSTRGTDSRYTDSFQAEGPGSRGFGERLEAALKSAGLDAESVKKVLSTLNGGKAKGGTDDASETSAVEGAGSRAFGQKLEAALKSAGLDSETVKNVLSTLNGGKGPEASSGSDLLSGLDDESAEQLQQAPDLAQQLSQYPGLFKQLVSQSQQSENTHVDTQSAST